MRISLVSQSAEVIKKFYAADLGRTGIVADSVLVQKANLIVDEIPTRFDFTIGLATTNQYKTQYSLNPRNTILVKEGATDLRRLLVHEIAHHCWHFVLDDEHKAQIMRFCDNRGLDSNEQFASSVEYFVIGDCLRFDANDPITSKKFAPKLKPIIENYFIL